MKTTISKNTIKNTRKDIAAMNEKLAQLRRDKRAMMDGLKREEEEILNRMFDLIPTLTKAMGRFPTAAEITRAMGGDMSRHEVVGNLLVALNDHFNGSSYPRPTKKATHKAVERRKGQMDRQYLTVTRRFVEVDDKGAPVQDGPVYTVEKHATTYGFKG